MGEIRLFGTTKNRLLQLRDVAKRHGYAYDFGKTFNEMADLLSDTIKKCRLDKKFNTSESLLKMSKIVPIGAPGVGYDVLAVVFSATFDIPLVDWDFFMEKPIVEFIEAGIIKSKDEFRSQSSAGKVGKNSYFNYTYKLTQYTSWVQWAEAVAKGNIPHCNAGKILKYSDIVSLFKKRGFKFVKIGVPLDRYIDVLNRYRYIEHHSNWQVAKNQGRISQFAEKRWKESEELFNQNKDLIDGEIEYNDDPIEMIKALLNFM